MLEEGKWVTVAVCSGWSGSPVFSSRVQNIQVGNNIIHINRHQVIFAKSSQTPYEEKTCVSCRVLRDDKTSEILSHWTSPQTSVKKKWHPHQKQGVHEGSPWPECFHANPRAESKIFLYAPGLCQLVKKWPEMIKTTKKSSSSDTSSVCIVCMDQEGGGHKATMVQGCFSLHGRTPLLSW